MANVQLPRTYRSGTLPVKKPGPQRRRFPGAAMVCGPVVFQREDEMPGIAGAGFFMASGCVRHPLLRDQNDYDPHDIEKRFDVDDIRNGRVAAMLSPHR